MLTTLPMSQNEYSKSLFLGQKIRYITKCSMNRKCTTIPKAAKVKLYKTAIIKLLTPMNKLDPMSTIITLCRMADISRINTLEIVMKYILSTLNLNNTQPAVILLKPLHKRIIKTLCTNSYNPSINPIINLISYNNNQLNFIPLRLWAPIQKKKRSARKRISLIPKCQ